MSRVVVIMSLYSANYTEVAGISFFFFIFMFCKCPHCFYGSLLCCIHGRQSPTQLNLTVNHMFII